MQFKIIEFQKNETGEEKQIAQYNVEQIDLSRTIDNLNDDVNNGRISRFEVANV